MSNLDFIRAFVVMNPKASFAGTENNYAIMLGSKVIRTKTLDKLASKIRLLK
jgi:hypothetical protein